MDTTYMLTERDAVEAVIRHACGEWDVCSFSVQGPGRWTAHLRAGVCPPSFAVDVERGGAGGFTVVKRRIPGRGSG